MTRRAGGWILVLLIVGAMAGGGWYVLRRVLWKHPVTIILLQGKDEREPTAKAIERGARFALEEWSSRAGRYRIFLDVPGPNDMVASSVWLGTSEARLLLGDHQAEAFFVSVVDTHPLEPTGCFRITPGCERQGQGAAFWAKKIKSATVFLLKDQPSLKSAAIAAAFDTRARELGMTVVGPVDTAVEQTALFDRILASRPDLVFYSGEEAPYGTAFQIFTGLRKRGYAGILATGEADPGVSFLATRPSLVEGTFLISPFAPAPSQLAARMASSPGPHVTTGYLAMTATLQAIDRANSMHPGPLKTAASQLSWFDSSGKSTRPCALYVARNGVYEFVELLQ